jgi:hypothetical protein
MFDAAKHTNPPEALRFFGELCVADTHLECTGPAWKIGNVIVEGFQKSKFLTTQGSSCTVRCFADHYFVFVTVSADGEYTDVRIQLYSHDNNTVLVECARDSGDRLLFSRTWQEVKAWLYGAGVSTRVALPLLPLKELTSE